MTSMVEKNEYYARYATWCVGLQLLVIHRSIRQNAMLHDVLFSSETALLL